MHQAPRNTKMSAAKRHIEKCRTAALTAKQKQPALGQCTYLIEKVKQLADVVCDRRRIWIATLQMLFVDLTNAFHALVDALVIGIGARLGTRARLNQQNCMRHRRRWCHVFSVFLPEFTRAQQQQIIERLSKCTSAYGNGRWLLMVMDSNAVPICLCVNYQRDGRAWEENHAANVQYLEWTRR